MTIKMIINNDNGSGDHNDDTDVKDYGVNDKNDSYSNHHEISGNEDDDDNDNNLGFLDFSNHVARFFEIQSLSDCP